MGVESWFVLAALLAPVGCVIQDVVADAMPVEAVPLVDEKGAAFDDRTIRLMHTTMQTLGRMAIGRWGDRRIRRQYRHVQRRRRT